MHTGGWFDRLVDFLALVAGLALVGLTVLISFDVLARYFRLFATPWTLDIAEYLLYIITFLGAPWVLKDGGHIAIDMFVQQLKPLPRRRAVTATNVVGAAVCIILFFYACRTWWRSFSENILIYETFTFPEWYLFSVAPPIFLILAVIFSRAIWRGTSVGEPGKHSMGGF